MILNASFFARPAPELAVALLGKVLRHRVEGRWLAARIIETEAYEVTEKASHSSLGWTHARRAMFMPPGTIYMYYARGADSLNFSAHGDGNAVLIKGAVPVVDAVSDQDSLQEMLNRNQINGRPRHPERLCAGQTLLCRSLGLKVPDWNARSLMPGTFQLEADGYQVATMLQCRRLGIPEGRDEALFYRFIDEHHAKAATVNPLASRSSIEGRDYFRVLSESLRF